MSDTNLLKRITAIPERRHLRRAALRKFKTVIVFEVPEAADEVEFIAVFNARRNPRYWMKRFKSGDK